MSALIRQAANDGVVMTLTVTGQIELTGDQAAIERWLPAIRENKPDIVAALQTDPAVVAIKAWLTHIGEIDPVMIAEALQRCRDDADALAYFLWRSGEVPNLDHDQADVLGGDDRVCGESRCPTPETIFRRSDSFKGRVPR